MRILLTADPEIPVPPKGYGGIERIVAGLIRYLRGQGHVVGLVAHPDSTETVDFRRSWPGARSQQMLDSWRNARTLARAVKDFQPDVLHSFSRLAYMALLPLLHRRLPLLMSYQREPSRRTTRWASRLAGKQLSFTACSSHIAELGRRGGGHWTVIPNFVDVEALPFAASVADDAPLLFLSRIERIKGVHTAIAVAKASGRRLLIAGNVPNDRQSREYFDNEVRPHLQAGVIDYLGEVDDTRKAQLLPAAAALLVPIEWEEPFGIVFAEALACGTPVLSCPRGALPDIVRNGVDGYLSNSVDELSARVSELPGLDRMGCRARALKSYSSAVVGQQYLRTYQSRLNT
jgi:glycosyltransferase involved in cell wall biosynthesis